MKRKMWSILFHGYTTFLAGATFVAAFVYALEGDAPHVFMYMVLFTLWVVSSLYQAEELAKE